MPPKRLRKQLKEQRARRPSGRQPSVKPKVVKRKNRDSLSFERAKDQFARQDRAKRRKRRRERMLQNSKSA